MKIIRKETLSQAQDTKITKIVVLAPDITHKVKAGQFVVLMACEEGERIPLTVVDRNLEEGSITLIFQELGLTTKLLGRLNVGDSLYALVGPLGHATEIKKYGKVILVGGGVGIAEIYPVAKALKDAGNHVETVIGSRTKSLLILEKELKGASDALHVATDDGTYARKGFTTDILIELLKKEKFDTFVASNPHPEGCGKDTPLSINPEANLILQSGESRRVDLVYAVGPIPMMKRVSMVTKDFGVKTIVSLNAIMVDGTGMCGCCRVDVAGKTQFSCVDGPEFDGHLVDWDGLVKRNSVYMDKEKHICKLVIK